MMSRCIHTHIHTHTHTHTAEALMPDGTFKEISLADYKGKFVVLVFYPREYLSVCVCMCVYIWYCVCESKGE